MNKSFDFCNKCRKKDDAAIIHCAVCSYPFHSKCVAPKLTVKACDDLISINNFQFYCDDHQNLCVHKLLNKISLLERKFKMCSEPLRDINQALEKHQFDLADSGYNKSPVQTPAYTASSSSNGKSPQQNVRITRSQRNKTSTAVAPIPLLLSSTQNKRDKRSGKSESSTEHKNNSASASLSSDKPEKSPVRQKDPISSLTDMEETPFLTASIPANILVALPPSKNIFLSGLSPDMTEKNVNDYINVMCDFDIPIKVRKMRLREGTDHSSFILYSGRNHDMFKMLIDPSFWPENSIVDEFVEHENFRNVKRNFKRLKPDLITSKPHRKRD